MGILGSSECFEKPAIESRLANDGKQGTNPDFAVVRDRYGQRAANALRLHDDMTPTSANLDKIMRREYRAHFAAG